MNSEEELEILRNIKPHRLELPVINKDDLVKLIGKYKRNGELGVPGAYIFINRKNNFCYVGSSISLANRLATGYLGPKLGNRKIDLAIKEAGIRNFCLDIYIRPSMLTVNEDNSNAFKSLTLALEQI